MSVMSFHQISDSDSNDSVVIDEDSDATVDISLEQNTAADITKRHSYGTHEISDSDSDQILYNAADNSKKNHQSAAECHSSDIISDTDSENERTKFHQGIHGSIKMKSKSSKSHNMSDSDEEQAQRKKDRENISRPIKRKCQSPIETKTKDALLPPKRNNNSIYDISTDELSSDEEQTNKKPNCPYGLKCYRKNPSHFEEFAHPEKHKEKSKSHAVHQASYSSELNFLLTKVTGISQDFNSSLLTIGIKDILSTRMGNLQKSAQFNYCIDVDWVVAQYPPQFRKLPLMIVHGSQRGEKADLDLAASRYDNVRMCQARMDIPYGTHHTKMMLLLYDKGLRVVIHTANLIDRDWFQKTQGVWLSPLYPKLSSPSSTAGDSPTHFKRDLLEYLTGYRSRPLEEWINILKEHDMSQTQVFLLASLPGRHSGDKKSSFGHMKLRKILQQHGPSTSQVTDWGVVGQFSSVGSLGATQDAWLCGEWLHSLSATKDKVLGAGIGKAKLRLIFPSVDNIRCSLEGYPAGGSVPYSINVAKKQPYLHSFFHQWKSEVRGRSRASPHIKTYLRASSDWQELAWFVVTSCNLSKAAWGALEKQQTQLMIRSYELGVLFLPHFFKSSAVSFSTCGGKEMSFPLPYELPPTPYKPTDKPWIWDIPHIQKPDSHGNMWCPS